MNAFSSVVCTILLAIIVCSVHADDASHLQEAEYIPLYSHVTNAGGDTNVWRITANDLKRVPLWKMDAGEPPLSVSKAIKIAKAWIVSKGCEKDSWVADMVIRPVYASSGRPLACYYNIRFGGVGIFGHFRRCILLMDGTVVEPIWLYRKAPGPSEYHYFDE